MYKRQDLGFRSVTIDYSLDGNNWTSLGNYNWPVASGDSEYSGFVGPDFNGIEARYILVTSNDNGACRGISKIAFTSRQCGPEGSKCDDGDPATAGDRFDNNCNCAGILGSENECVNDTLMLGDSVLTMTMYSAIKLVQSNSELDAHSNATFMANEQVELLPGFESANGSILEIQIETCEAPQSIKDQELVQALKRRIENEPLLVTALEEDDEQVIQYYVSQPGAVKLELRDANGKLITTLLDHTVRDAGYYVKRVRTTKLSNVNYQVHLVTSQGLYRKKMTLVTNDLSK